MKLKDLFNYSYGSKLDFNKMIAVNDQEESGINFVTRSSKKLGISTKIKKMPDLDPYPAGSITVTLGGTYLLSSFIQPEPFYTAQNIMILTPKEKMSLEEKIYYCICIAKNRFKYSAFGREANRTLMDLDMPDRIPKWIDQIHVGDPVSKKSFHQKSINLLDRKWKPFEIQELFFPKRGNFSGLKNNLMGNTRVISATTQNNGLSCFINKNPEYAGNVFTIANTGQGSVGTVFYQDQPFIPSNNITVLIPKFNLNEYVAMFLLPLFKKERYKLSFGRILNERILNKHSIKLPVGKDNNPDWQFMEDYIKSLPYSNSLISSES